MNYKELLFNKDKVLTFCPELAVILNEYDKYLVRIEYEANGKKWKSKQCGLNAAIIVNQINYWNELNEKLRSEKHFKDGYYWTYHAYDKWAKEDFPFWSGDTVRRSVRFLEDIGIVISTDEYNSWKADNTKWYRIDYDKFQKVINIVDKLRKEKQSEEKENDKEDKKQVADTVNAHCGCVMASCIDSMGIAPKAIPEITNRDYNKDYSSEITDNSSSKDEDPETIPPEGGHNSSSRRKKTTVGKNKNLSESELGEAVSQMPLRAGNIVYQDTGNKNLALSIKAFMQYFLNAHKRHTGARHSILTDEVLRRVIETVTSEIPIMQDGYMLVYVPLVTEDCEARDYEKIVDIYFATKFKQKIDYSIVHFTSKGVLTNMMNHDEEVWYMSESL